MIAGLIYSDTWIIVLIGIFPGTFACLESVLMLGN
jgi:hypothetical protein